MKQVKFRSVLLLLLIVLLGLGLALFCLRYTFRGEAWASFSANGQAYTDGVVRTGQVLDRNGTVLYDGHPPRCGGSAGEHLHLGAGGVPVPAHRL